MGAALFPPCAPTQFITPPSPTIVRAPCDLWALLRVYLCLLFTDHLDTLSRSLLASNALRCSGIAYFHPRRSQLYLPLKLVLRAPACFSSHPNGTAVLLPVFGSPPTFPRLLASSAALRSLLTLPVTLQPCLATALTPPLPLFGAAVPPTFPPPAPRLHAFQRHPYVPHDPPPGPPPHTLPAARRPRASFQRLCHPRRFCLVPTPRSLTSPPPASPYAPCDPSRSSIPRFWLLGALPCFPSMPLFPLPFCLALTPLPHLHALLETSQELSPVPTGRSAPAVTTHRCCPPSPLYWLPLLFPHSRTIGCCRALRQFLTAPSFVLDPLNPARSLCTPPRSLPTRAIPALARCSLALPCYARSLHCPHHHP
ncbi:hypothetical protein B0H14DRAFT_3465689 [Mycena olivaceomarginata]|nr:hypothetical protein B0H14DRAFT_3465689 [Mycena olivaceomarginata]